MFSGAHPRLRSDSDYLSGVFPSLSESFGVVRSRPKSSRVVQSHRNYRSRPESIGVDRNRHQTELTFCCVFFVFHFARAVRIRAFVSKADSGQLGLTLDDSDYSGRLRPTQNNSERLRTTPYDSDFERLRTTPGNSGRFRTTPNNVGRFYPLESIPNLSEPDRSRLRIFCQLYLSLV